MTGRTPALALLMLLAACGADAPAPASDGVPAPDGPVPFADAATVGPKAGATVPMDAALVRADGSAASLAALAGGSGATLVFTRSVDWCPFCKAQLARLDAIAPEAERAGYPLVGISYDDPAKLAAFAKRSGARYALASDGGSKLIDALGLRDPQYRVGFAVGVPFASVLVIDREGKVLQRAVSTDYKVRPENEQVLALIRAAAG